MENFIYFSVSPELLLDFYQGQTHSGVQLHLPKQHNCAFTLKGNMLAASPRKRGSPSSCRATLKDIHNSSWVCSHFSCLQRATTPLFSLHNCQKSCCVSAATNCSVASMSSQTNLVFLLPKFFMKLLLISCCIHARPNEGALKFGVNFCLLFILYSGAQCKS